MATKSLSADNFFSTTLSGAITASDTVIPLSAVPSSSEGYLVINSESATKREIIYYTSKGASSVTCPSAAAGRGVGGTTAQSHDSGEPVEMNMTAEHFKALQDGTALADASIVPAKLSNPYKFRAYLASNQTGVTDATEVLVNFDTESYDTNNNFNTTTHLYTVPVTGYYQVNAQLSTTSSAENATALVLVVYKNATQVMNTTIYDNAWTLNSLTGTASDVIYLTAGDTLSVKGYIDVASGTGTFLGGYAATFFSAHLLSV